jgi:hypothetical protein
MACSLAFPTDGETPMSLEINESSPDRPPRKPVDLPPRHDPNPQPSPKPIDDPRPATPGKPVLSEVEHPKLWLDD